MGSLLITFHSSVQTINGDRTVYEANAFSGSQLPRTLNSNMTGYYWSALGKMRKRKRREPLTISHCIYLCINCGLRSRWCFAYKLFLQIVFPAWSDKMLLCRNIAPKRNVAHNVASAVLKATICAISCDLFSQSRLLLAALHLFVNMHTVTHMCLQ